jgi:ParB-like chromosome segregation protein Spo0J
MKWVGYQQLPLSKLKLPGDIKARMSRPRVEDLANSIQLLGDEPINALTVEKDGLVLIAGRDRTAALMKLGVKKVWCHLVTELSDQDRLDLEIDENLHRRQDNRDDLIAKRVKRVEGELLDKMSDNSPRQPGRPKSTKAAAREVVARELDTTPEAVRAAEKRATAPEEESAAAPVEIAPPVETWDVPVEHLAQEFASVRIAQEAMRAADRHMQQAQRALSALEDGGGIAGQLHSRLYGGVHATAAQLRASIPSALCPYCKGLANRRATCGGCGALGYVGDDALLGVADELKRRGADAVVPDGRGGFVKVMGGTAGNSGVSGRVEPAAVPPTSRRLNIQDAAGNPIVVPDEDIADEDIPF